MRDTFFEIAPITLPVCSVAIWIVTFILCDNAKLNMIPIYSIFGQLFLSFCCGLIIRRLHRQVIIDDLTNVYNRRCLFFKIPKILKVKLPVSLMIIDIDNFKRINDTYGHSAGDKLLKRFSEVLKRNIRSTDIVVRMGGEEFAVIMPKTGCNNVLKTAERVRQAIEAESFIINSVTDGITISIGITTTIYPMHIDSILEYADRALYKAKETKNTIIFNNTPGLCNGGTTDPESVC